MSTCALLLNYFSSTICVFVTFWNRNYETLLSSII